ncbi:class I SAM-dependent methyltransferase [Streptomyces luteireticuli]|uniref:class I SAM-dependent methyltransferase n=1 Tax=Streptomyces luteireticuli TaxID=173858 RepID=UPI003555E9E7
MPTIPPEHPSPSGRFTRESHQHRDMAESFGSDAERYDRARPRYPDALIDRIAAGSPGPDVLDVGCGTGIAARQFRAAGCRVLGVDADARMAAFARRYGLETEVAPFESWDAGGRTFDVVVAAQTWHWIDPVAGAAKAAAVLRPGGRLAVFWNVAQPPPEVAEAFAAVFRRVVPGAPLNPWAPAALDAQGALFAKAADGMRRSGAFGASERWRADWDREYTRDQWLDQLPTSGLTARLSPSALDALLAGTAAAVDARGGRFTMRYAAVAVTAVRTGAS